MKCPKCGSEELIITNYNEAEIVERLKESHYKCKLCDTRFNEHALGTVCVISKTPTTAEMLLWLFRNTNFRIKDGQELGFYIDEIWHGFDFFFQSKNEAIKQAYDWARKEVTNGQHNI